MSERTVLACPGCDSGQVHINTSRGAVNDAPRYRCKACQQTFDEPVERPPKPSGHGTPTRGLAARLAKMGEESSS